MNLFCPNHWTTYELIDSGGFEKLERFGEYILARPEPQALWDKSLSVAEWERMAHAVFKKEKGNADKGEWQLKKGTPERWAMHYKHGPLNLRFKIALSSFKHVGLFPEQAINWDFIAKSLSQMSAAPRPRVLNLFAYTGVASLAARQCGAEVTHLEAIKQTINWAKENMEMSKLDNIRWMLDDALKFVKREVRRGAIYQGIILDPPAYGRGPDGEKWVLEEGLNELLKLSSSLLDPTQHFFILNLYSLGFSPLIAQNLMEQAVGRVDGAECGELYVEDSFRKKLPLGLLYRYFKS